MPSAIAAQVTLVARFCQRLGDHAVNSARRVELLHGLAWSERQIGGHLEVCRCDIVGLVLVQVLRWCRSQHDSWPASGL